MLDAVLAEVGKAFNDVIAYEGTVMVGFDIGPVFEQMGYQDDAALYRNTIVYLPYATYPGKGINVAERKSRLAGYFQLDSGVIISPRLAESTKLNKKPFDPPGEFITMNSSTYVLEPETSL